MNQVLPLEGRVVLSCNLRVVLKGGLALFWKGLEAKYYPSGSTSRPLAGFGD